ncbi:MAG: TIGR03617 family F420-dependent LLM class oxidoreductase [Dehalococcoidia bacterium]|jgi:probable F420-dependent oxidoreductase|nr:TIGR03617 family F420-dependent LLM class oxidoreductase [Dehalococcoidia bacterium]MDW8007951.1 TIGR03617 family F420-dependent LLM class oxidoreductase [Chloroflexota bacterium]
MKVEATITAPSSIDDIVNHARHLEELGFDTILVPEAGHDPFLPVMVLAEHTSRVTLGTGVAVAFPRSPFVTAQIAWDLQRFSGGRFQLGLGTQVRAHNERRYSTPWTGKPVARLREYILCMRAIFQTFHQPERPQWFTGKYYQFTLINPFFNPGPWNGNPKVPIYIAGLNRLNCQLAGEVCDGLRIHTFVTPRYIREVVVPAVHEGARRAGRDPSEIDIVGNIFVITGETKAEMEEAREVIRHHISFYGATKTYFPVLEMHGWAEIGERLVRLSREGRWRDMPALISNEIVSEMSVMGSLSEIPSLIKERYGGLITSINMVFGPPYERLQERQRRLFEIVGKHLMADLKAI